MLSLLECVIVCSDLRVLGREANVSADAFCFIVSHALERFPCERFADRIVLLRWFGRDWPILVVYGYARRDALGIIGSSSSSISASGLLREARTSFLASLATLSAVSLSWIPTCARPEERGACSSLF